MIVADFFQPHDAAFYDCLARSGIEGIARYLTNSLLEAREITPDEVNRAHAAGLSIHFFYEMNPTYPAYFTFPQGAEDCRQAIARLDDLHAPDGSVVYFAVDTNIPPSLVDMYAAGIESMITPRIAPGLYGYQRLMEHARTKPYAKLGKHLWQTYGTVTGPLDAQQNLQEDRCGVAIDLNDCNVEGWTSPMAITGDQAKDLIREMIESEEGANLVYDAIAHKYGPALQAQLDALKEALLAADNITEVKAVVESLLDVQPFALKPTPTDPPVTP